MHSSSMKNFISLFALTWPYIYEIIAERKGEAASAKTKSVIIRVGIAIVAAIIGFVLIGKAVFDGVFLSLSVHWILFDYSMAAILIGSGIVEPGKGQWWFTYLGSTAETDKNKFWRNLHPMVRFSIRLLVLLLASFIYFVEYKFIK